ncbi:hypothetical protein IQ07DRAFT_367926 [Pyrenochaeta sp. DS3sAY3a]|nr:hypothetical protein IQ07DRAFT_367926 [Pyrenochaeta sp. DS3sAY3a]
MISGDTRRPIEHRDHSHAREIRADCPWRHITSANLGVDVEQEECMEERSAKHVQQPMSALLCGRRHRIALHDSTRTRSAAMRGFHVADEKRSLYPYPGPLLLSLQGHRKDCISLRSNKEKLQESEGRWLAESCGRLLDCRSCAVSNPHGKT